MTRLGFIAPCPLTVAGRARDMMLAGNAYSALKDITALSRELPAPAEASA